MKKIIVVCFILLGCLVSCNKPKEKESDLVYNQHSKSLILKDTSYYISTIQVIESEKKDTAFVEFADKLANVNLNTIPNYRTKEVLGNFDNMLTSNKLDFIVLLERKENKEEAKFFKFKTNNPDSHGNIYAREYGK